MSGRTIEILMYGFMTVLVLSVLAVGFEIARLALQGLPRVAGRARSLAGARGAPFALLVVSVFGAFGLRAKLERQVRAELHSCLANLEGPIWVDERPCANPAGVVAALDTIEESVPHHSVALGRTALVLHCSGQSLEVQVAKDSKKEGEYWVFYPKYRATRLTAIGRVQSSAFADSIGVPALQP